MENNYYYNEKNKLLYTQEKVFCMKKDNELAKYLSFKVL